MRKFRVDALIEGVPWGLPRATTLGESPSFCPPVNSDEHLSPSPLKRIVLSDISETRVRLPSPPLVISANALANRLDELIRLILHAGSP